MTSVRIRLASERGVAGSANAFRLAVSGSLRRIAAELMRVLASDSSPAQLLRLSDHLLDDMGIARADLEDEAIQWPFGRPRSVHRH